jgi:hypothetical protein
VIQSLSFIFKSDHRFVNDNRHSSKSTITTIPSLSLSLSQPQNEIDDLRKQCNPGNPLSDSPQIELFKHLRQQCNDQNPHSAGLVNLTASSIDHSNYDSHYIFESSRETFWCSKDEPNQWLLFDLKELLFKIEKIYFDVCFGGIPRHWRLLGSNDNQTWTPLHDQGNDERCLPEQHFPVDYNIQSSGFFTFFKFEHLDVDYDDSNGIAFFSIEFIGRLNSQSLKQYRNYTVSFFQ